MSEPIRSTSSRLNARPDIAAVRVARIHRMQRYWHDDQMLRHNGMVLFVMWVPRASFRTSEKLETLPLFGTTSRSKILVLYQVRPPNLTHIATLACALHASKCQVGCPLALARWMETSSIIVLRFLIDLKALTHRHLTEESSSIVALLVNQGIRHFCGPLLLGGGCSPRGSSARSRDALRSKCRSAAASSSVRAHQVSGT